VFDFKTVSRTGQIGRQETRQKLKILSLTKPPDNSVPSTNRLKYQNNILFTKHVQDKKLFNTGKVCPVLFCLILIFSNQTDPWGVTNRVYLWNRTCKSSLLYISENWYKDFRLALIDLWLWILVRRTDVTDWLNFLLNNFEVVCVKGYC
jgi:hypothetical protein